MLEIIKKNLPTLDMDTIAQRELDEAEGAEHLLQVIEAAGMLPPSIRIKTPLGPRIFFDTNEWEEDVKYDEEGYPIK